MKTAEAECGCGFAGGSGCVPGGAVQVAAVDEAVFGVSPVQLLLIVVQGQPVGPVNLLIDDHGAVGPIHARTLNLWYLTPVSPVHEANTQTAQLGSGSGLNCLKRPPTGCEMFWEAD